MDQKKKPKVDAEACLFFLVCTYKKISNSTAISINRRLHQL